MGGLRVGRGDLNLNDWSGRYGRISWRLLSKHQVLPVREQRAQLLVSALSKSYLSAAFRTYTISARGSLNM